VKTNPAEIDTPLAHAEGQTGELQTFIAGHQDWEGECVTADYAKQLLAQRDSARKERDDWKERARLANTDREVTRDHNVQLEAQLAAMRKQIDSQIASNVEKDSKSFSTSGQALLDRLKAKDVALTAAKDALEAIKSDVFNTGKVAGRSQTTGEDALRAIASAMRKDGHE
jgi:hypothetical protein